MTVTAIETHFGAIAAGASAVVSVSTSLVATDRLVLVLYKTSTTGTPSVTGLGTWSVLEQVIVTRDSYLYTMTGATAGGNLTITPTSLAADYALYVLRGGGGQVDVFGSEQGYTSSGTASETPAISGALGGMFVVAAVAATAGATITFPAGTSVPSSGWSADYTGVNNNAFFISNGLSAGANVVVGVTATSGTAKTILVGVFSEAAGLPPLTSTFVGWGNPIF